MGKTACPQLGKGGKCTKELREKYWCPSASMCFINDSEEAEPIYEKISHQETLIMTKQGNTLLYATNNYGVVEFKKATLEEK